MSCSVACPHCLAKAEIFDGTGEAKRIYKCTEDCGKEFHELPEAPPEGCLHVTNGTSMEPYYMFRFWDERRAAQAAFVWACPKCFGELEERTPDGGARMENWDECFRVCEDCGLEYGWNSHLNIWVEHGLLYVTDGEICQDHSK